MESRGKLLVFKALNDTLKADEKTENEKKARKGKQILAYPTKEKEKEEEQIILDDTLKTGENTKVKQILDYSLTEMGKEEANSILNDILNTHEKTEKKDERKAELPLDFSLTEKKKEEEENEPNKTLNTNEKTNTEDERKAEQCKQTLDSSLMEKGREENESIPHDTSNTHEDTETEDERKAEQRKQTLDYSPTKNGKEEEKIVHFTHCSINETISNMDPILKCNENKSDYAKPSTSAPGGQTSTRHQQEKSKWTLQSTSETKLRLKRVANAPKFQFSDSSESEMFDNTDSDPDFDIANEYPKQKKTFKFNKLFKKRKIKNYESDSSSAMEINHESDSMQEIDTTQTEDSIGEDNRNILEETSLERPKAKKRKAQPNKWIKTQAKLLRNSGKKYTSVSKTKKEVPEKMVQPPCGEKCRLKCTSEISEEQRKVLFSKFWELGDINRQRDFISKCLVCVEPKYRYPKAENNRRLNNAFYLTVNDKRIRVCKTFFTATLDIPYRYIRTVINKMEHGFLKEDLRGKHGKHKTVNPDIKTGVRNHIDSIPRIESHYLRKQTTREFIEGGKNLSDLYRDYKADCIKNNQPFANFVMYSRIFNFENNISFFKPKKDQCDTCAGYELASEEDKLRLKESYELHLIEKDLSRKEKEIDKKNINKTKVVACYDLQAVFPVPKGEVSLFYYKSKLNCLNFTICELKKPPENRSNENKSESTSKKNYVDEESQLVYCFAWHEAEGNRGVNELGSCVFKYLEEKANAIDDPNLEIVIYSDNCGGQQKNKFMISMYTYAVSVLKIKSITHKFLIKGHTQNEGDSAHSVIEKATQKALKSGPIYVPSQYFSIIRNAKKTGAPFIVKELCHRDFYDLKQLYKDCGYLTQKPKIKKNEVEEVERKEKNMQKSEKISSRKTKKPRDVAEKSKLNKECEVRSLNLEPTKAGIEEGVYAAGLPSLPVRSNHAEEVIEEDEESFKLSKAIIIRVEKNDPTKVLYKNSYAEEKLYSYTLPIKRRHKGRIEDVSLKQAHKSKLPLAERKKSDILSLIKANLIPQYYRDFYENL